jgi:hypothetical protein
LYLAYVWIDFVVLTILSLAGDCHKKYRVIKNYCRGFGWSLSGRPARQRPTALLPPRSYGKPEAAVAVDRLLMMGKRMPETC